MVLSVSMIISYRPVALFGAVGLVLQLRLYEPRADEWVEDATPELILHFAVLPKGAKLFYFFASIYLPSFFLFPCKDKAA